MRNSVDVKEYITQVGEVNQKKCVSNMIAYVLVR